MKQRAITGASKKTCALLTLFLASMLFTTFENAFSIDSLVLEGVRTWYWLDDTYLRSVASADVDGDGDIETVTGGRYLEWGARWWAQLAVWDGATLSLENVVTWYWVGSTYIYAVDAADVDGDGSVEIVTGGHYNDGGRGVAQLAVWNGATLNLEGVRTWYWVTDTEIWSATVADVDGDLAMEIVTGGWSWGERSSGGLVKVAQLCVWGFT